ncbi:type I-C CRISPR-associated protein Cas8c/Csd1 [uncultured Porticoccus sp.]|uniref:type I-C CRISPR-associated protein Cas8c/Csd1 n=1 Tax=uncultured Porticoccus sp. TaxID=1256050 RepID=UPI0030DB348C|tara:strand:- start:1193 stop:3067 length:1875 start_codon:yes stop_codon:yes gene_type:complete
MILSALNDYYERLLCNPNAGMSPPGCSSEQISYAIVLDREGSVVAVDDIRDTSSKRPVAKRLIVPASFKRSGSVFKPFFLWDKTSYVLGVSGVVEKAKKKQEKGEDLSAKEKKELKNKIERLPQEFESFKRFHVDALNGTEDDGLNAFLHFIKNWNPEKFSEIDFFGKHGDGFLDANVVFRLDGDHGYLHESPAARVLYNQPVASGKEEKAAMCLITGETGPIARIHESIKGVKDAQSSGASIVSFNKESFTSYGKNQGENAPVSAKAASAYITALNYLLKSERQHIQIGDATVVFWAEASNNEDASVAEDIFAAFLNPEDDDLREAGKIRDALELIKQGKPLSSLDVRLRAETCIFILGLAPNASRLSIRFWETDTLEAFAKRLAQHYEDLHLEPSPWKTPPAIWRLLLATAPSRDGKSKSGDVPPHLAGELARAILTGGRYPYSLLGNIIMRMRADGDISGTRVALIKGVLTRFRRLGGKGTNNGDLPMSLDTKNTDPGYLLGRLFASLEGIQRGALGKEINATIRDRYYGAASATPASIFPILLRNTQNHLSKIRKEKPGLAVSMEKEVGEIFGLLGTTFPKSLRLENQGHFAIGYYHQSQSRFAKKSEQEVIHSNEGEDA